MEIEQNTLKINPLNGDCKKVLNESTNNKSTLEALQKDPGSYIYDYFGEIIRQVDLRREELKSKVNSYSDEMVQSIEITKGVNTLNTKIDNQKKVLTGW